MKGSEKYGTIVLYHKKQIQEEELIVGVRSIGMFTFNRNTNFIAENASVPVRNAISLLERDRNEIFLNSSKPGGSVVLVQKSMARSGSEPEESEEQRRRESCFAEERYKISVSSDKIVIFAQGDRGFIYGLLYLSEHYLGVCPFWFFMDRRVEQKKKVHVQEGVVSSKDPVVPERGWCFNDRTLMSGWSYNENGMEGWKMCLEALLRCGGNTVVAGSEEISEAVCSLAEEYGLRQTNLQKSEETAFCFNLQPSNHVTMLPHSVASVNQSFHAALQQGKNSSWIVQCSNVRPHVYFLDVVRKKWQGEEVSEASQAEAFVCEYYTECEKREEIAALYMEYPSVMMRLEEKEEGIGELYYTENVRLFCHQLLVDKNSPAKELLMLVENESLSCQIREFGEVCKQQKEELEQLCVACTVVENGLQQKALLSATIGLHIKLHQTCRRAARCFARGYESFLEGDYERAFLRFGDSAVWFDKGDALLRGAEYGVWKNFYANDCITDIKHTAYMVRKVMGVVRELGDNAKHDSWYQKYCLSAEEQEVKRNHIAENHKTDLELYEAMKKRVVR